MGLTDTVCISKNTSLVIIIITHLYILYKKIICLFRWKTGVSFMYIKQNYLLSTLSVVVVHTKDTIIL